MTSVGAVAIDNQLDGHLDVLPAFAMTPEFLAPRSLIRALAVIAVGAGCASMLPPARSSGAALSEEGIELAVIGQVCRNSRDGNASTPPSVDAILSIEVGNPTPDPVAVHPDKLILITPAGVSVRPSTSEPASPLSVDGGTTVRLTLHFMVTGGTCSQEMQLDASSALQWQGRPVTVSAIRFVPVAPL